MAESGIGIDPQSISNFIDTGDYRVHYYDVGVGHPIILLHGSGPGATGWSNFWPNIEALSATNRVLAVDMPGWGHSDTEKVGGPSHSATLIALMDKLDMESAALVGNSMGGMTGIRTAADHPSRVTHLITMGAPSPGSNYFSPGPGLSEGLKILLEAYADPSPKNMKRLVSIMCFDQEIATDDLASMRSEAAQANPDHLAGFLSRRWDDDYDSLYTRLSKLPMPALFIHGRDDRVVGFENSLRLATLVPDSRLLLINQCGHWAQIEHADEFNRVVADFIANA